MRKQINLLFLNCFALGILFISGCSYNELPDPADPRLPIYSEEGRNTGGAIINDLIWTGDQGICAIAGCFPNPNLVSDLTKDSLVIGLSGEIHDTRQYTSIYFGLGGQRISSLDELKTLEGQTIILDGQTNSAYVATRYNPDFPNSTMNCEDLKGTGTLYLHKVSNGIIAGTFYFKIDAPQGCTSLEMYHGRFDYSYDEITIIQ